MLQLNLEPYASDALEDAMRLAETKALNSYTFSDCLSYLNWAWMDMFIKIAQADEGYYSRTVQLTKKLTKLPPFVKHTIKVYAAQSPNGKYAREVYRESGFNDLDSYNTYHISGFDLYCPDAVRRKVWLNYIPMQPMIFFTHRNRDPKLYAYPDGDTTGASFVKTNRIYNTWNLVGSGTSWSLTDRMNRLPTLDLSTVLPRNDWDIVFISCDYPYIFATYKHTVTGEHRSGFYIEITQRVEWVDYNPFDWLGRNSNVEYLQVSYNDKTGMGAIIKDWNDMYNIEDPTAPGVPGPLVPRIKELGWTPDSCLNYPVPEMYRLLVAKLADKLSAMNESNVMAIQKELKEATDAFDLCVRKNKSAWQRIDNVNGPTWSDLL